VAFRQIQISRNSLGENPLVADMKWFISLVVAIAVVSLAYAGTAFVSLGSLATAAREGDGARLMAMSDVPRVRHALVEQIINAYLERIGQKRELKPFERMAVQTFGASIADEVAIKLTTPENLSAILKSGAVRDAANKIDISNMPPLADFDVSSIFNVVEHVVPIKLVEFSLRLGADPSAGAIRMHFAGLAWKLSGLELPAAMVSKLVDRLPG
jgi:hypothetical protein